MNIRKDLEELEQHAKSLGNAKTAFRRKPYIRFIETDKEFIIKGVQALEARNKELEGVDLEDPICLKCSRLKFNGGTCEPNTNSFVTHCKGHCWNPKRVTSETTGKGE